MADNDSNDLHGDEPVRNSPRHVSLSVPLTVSIGIGEPGPPTVATASPGTVSIAFPLAITVALGQPVPVSLAAGDVGRRPASAKDIDAAARALSAAFRHAGVASVTPGRLIESGRATDRPCLRAVVPPDRLAEATRVVPRDFQGIPVALRAATPVETIEIATVSSPSAEAVTSIRYNDADRTGPQFSFDVVDEPMKVLCHVGPERSWVVLKEFLGAARKELVSSIYEFHARHIADALAARLGDDVKLDLVLAIQSRDPKSAQSDDDDTFNRAEVFANWERQYRDNFDHVFVPIGSDGLVANAYHIKVTVRDGKTVWLSSGNWKGSSQPRIKREDLDKPAKTNAAGNREWHVVLDNDELALRFKSHIREDLAQSRRLGQEAEAAAAPPVYVDVPLASLEAIEREAAPPQVLQPKLVSGQIRVKPLLTPDQKGAIYCNAVLSLIKSAKRQLLFQIPYITLTETSPPQLRELVEAMVSKSTGIDVRVILRSDHGSWKPGALALSDAGMDVEILVRILPRTHTKGMVVDGERVLLGSHNWSGPGVTLNRDASLIFDGNTEIADYYRTAFEFDWARAKPTSLTDAMQQQESVVPVDPAVAPRPGHRRMRLVDYLGL